MPFFPAIPGPHVPHIPPVDDAGGRRGDARTHHAEQEGNTDGLSSDARFPVAFLIVAENVQV